MSVPVPLERLRQTTAEHDGGYLLTVTDDARPHAVHAAFAWEGDVLVAEAKVPPGVAVGDLVATPVTGAYGRSMGSNYNLLARPAVVFVADGKARLVIRRETEQDLLATDVG